MTGSTFPPFGMFNTEAHIIHSSCANQDFQIGVWFPFSYAGSPERKFPVLYVPDGEFSFPVAAGLIPTLMGEGEVPEMLVVGIAYHGIQDWGEFGILRDRDYCIQQFLPPSKPTRHAEYTQFYKEELFPFIESHYHADPQERAVFGFSGAGFFAMHMLLTQPGMFRRAAAASCTWPGAGEYLLACAENYAANPTPADAFLGVGANDAGQVDGFQRLADTLGRCPSLRFSSQVFSGEGHSAGVIAQTFLQGVKAVFRPAAG